MERPKHIGDVVRSDDSTDNLLPASDDTDREGVTMQDTKTDTESNEYSGSELDGDRRSKRQMVQTDRYVPVQKRPSSKPLPSRVPQTTELDVVEFHFQKQWIDENVMKAIDVYNGDDYPALLRGFMSPLDDIIHKFPELGYYLARHFTYRGLRFAAAYYVQQATIYYCQRYTDIPQYGQIAIFQARCNSAAILYQGYLPMAEIEEKWTDSGDTDVFEPILKIKDYEMPLKLWFDIYASDVRLGLWCADLLQFTYVTDPNGLHLMEDAARIFYSYKGDDCELYGESEKNHDGSDEEQEELDDYDKPIPDLRQIAQHLQKNQRKLLDSLSAGDVDSLTSSSNTDE